MNDYASRLIRVDDTGFIFQTNFSGDPRRDNYGSDARRGNIILPDPALARQLIDAGFNVKMSKPREDEEEDFTPSYFISVKMNFESAYPPKIYLVSGDSEPVALGEGEMTELDRLNDERSIKNVCAVLNPYENPKTGNKSLYVKTMYVEQDLEDDPYYERYWCRG